MTNFKYIGAVDEEGITHTHVRCTLFGYDTLCGLSLSDDVAEECEPVSPKIDCHQCYALWVVANNLGARDFAADVKR